MTNDIGIDDIIARLVMMTTTTGGMPVMATMMIAAVMTEMIAVTGREVRQLSLSTAADATKTSIAHLVLIVTEAESTAIATAHARTRLGVRSSMRRTPTLMAWSLSPGHGGTVVIRMTTGRENATGREIGTVIGTGEIAETVTTTGTTSTNGRKSGPARRTEIGNVLAVTAKKTHQRSATTSKRNTTPPAAAAKSATANETATTKPSSSTPPNVPSPLPSTPQQALQQTKRKASP
jgi:hypothetical protein